MSSGKSQTTSPRQPCTGHQREKDRTTKSHLAKNCGGRNEAPERKLEHPPENSKRQQKWRDLVAALHAKGVMDSK
jgi:hypothetical protein